MPQVGLRIVNQAKRRLTSRPNIPQHLASLNQMSYDSSVPEKEGTRCGSLKSQKRISRAMRLFYACLPSCPLNGAAMVGESSGSLAYFCGQSSKPAICRSPRLEAGLRCNSQKEAHMPNRSCTSVHSCSKSNPTLAAPAVHVAADIDCQDKLDATSAKLNSLLALLSGEGFGSFKNMAEEHQQNLLWMASELADEIVCLGRSKVGEQA
jgi:hypothetical protein